jgi:hypothetical protein
MKGSFTCTNLRHSTDGFTSPPKEGMLRIFSPWKIRRLQPGLNPRSSVPEGSMLTTRPSAQTSKLTKILSVWARVVPCGRTDGQIRRCLKLIFRDFANAPKNSTFRPQSAVMRFGHLSEETAVISHYSTNGLVLKAETENIYRAVRP